MFHVASYHENFLKPQICGATTNRIYCMEPIRIKIKVVFHWMYVQPLLLSTTIYVNEGIYQNVCMCVHKTEMKVLME